MKGNKLGSLIVLAGVAGLIFMLSAGIMWYGDVLLYQFSFNTGEPLRGVGDIPESMWRHFFNQNGRIVAHTLVQLFCSAGQSAFAACNALVYVGLILLIMKYAGVKRLTVKMTLAASLLTLFFCDTSYIPPHQIGYIWMSCTAIGFLIIYDKLAVSTERNHSSAYKAIECVMLFVLGLLCGNGNESIDLGIGVALCVEMGLRCLQPSGSSRRFSDWRRIMLLGGFCIGVCVLCLSPSQISSAFHRYQPPMVVSLYNLVVSLRAFWVFAVVLLVSCLRHKVRLGGFVAENRELFIAMVVMFVFNLAITVKVNRQLFGVELYSTVLTLRLLRHFRVSWAWLATGVAVVAAQYYMKFSTVADFNSDEAELRRQLMVHGNKPLYIDLLHHNPYVHPTEELSYHDCANLLFHVASCADDINGRGSFYSRHVNNPFEFVDNVVLYPVALKQIETEEPRNRVVHCGNGVYMLLRLKERPAQFVLHRSFDILGLRVPMSPVDISFAASQHRPTDIYDVFVTTFPYPLMHVDSVTMNLE